MNLSHNSKAATTGSSCAWQQAQASEHSVNVVVTRYMYVPETISGTLHGHHDSAHHDQYSLYYPLQLDSTPLYSSG